MHTLASEEQNSGIPRERLRADVAWLCDSQLHRHGVPVGFACASGADAGRGGTQRRKRNDRANSSPLGDRAFRRLLVYRCWFSFFNGITQAAQNVYVYVLGIGVLPMQLMQLGMRGGQMALSPTIGRSSDRVGNRPILELSQALVAIGPLFYLLATPAHPWWVAGAWVAWSAYAGLNICLTNIMLKLAPPQNNASYIAAFEALGGVAYGLSTLAGGVLLDQLRDAQFHVTLGGVDLDHFAILFLVGAVTRALGVVWLARVPEPGAKTSREMLGAKPSATFEARACSLPRIVICAGVPRRNRRTFRSRIARARTTRRSGKKRIRRCPADPPAAHRTRIARTT